MRVNARLDEERAMKLAQLQSLTQSSVSDVLKRAIDHLHREQMACSREKLKGLTSSDFIGCAEGPPNLANDYKRYIAGDLAGKHGAG